MRNSIVAALFLVKSNLFVLIMAALANGIGQFNNWAII